MAQGVGVTKEIIGVSDVFGGHYYSPLDYSGPASYVQGGDTIDAASFGFDGCIQTLTGSVSQSGNYRVDPRPLSSGVQTEWQLVWVVVSTGAQVANAVNLSGETVRLSAIGY
jgi:hypothetical protein